MKKIFLPCVRAMLVLGAPFISPMVPVTANADIYKWEDENGTIHFTDAKKNIPQKYRSRQKTVQRDPSDKNRPGLTILKTTPPGPSPFVAQPEPTATPNYFPQKNFQAEAEQLLAKIKAKKKFIEDIDLKRSHVLNPLGNRFVAPEDLELYDKYSEELPQDQKRLEELQSNLP